QPGDRAVSSAARIPLKGERTADLDDACCVLRAGDATERRPGVHTRIRISELRVVPGVEELATQGELHLAIKREGLVGAHVPVIQAGASHAVELEVAECI